MSKAAFEMEERKEPKFVTFADGSVVDGILTRIDRVEVEKDGKKSPVTRYTVLDPDTREMQCFLGTYMIDAKLRREDIGHYIEVRSEGENRSVSRNGNAMKVFKVRVSKEPVANHARGAGKVDPLDSTVITDEDIPF